MPEMKGSVTSNRLIDRELRALLREYVKGPIVGALTVQGHPHWWILEYGSGSRLQAKGWAEGPALRRPSEPLPRVTSGYGRSAGSGKYVIKGVRYFPLVRIGNRTERSPVPMLRFRNRAGRYILRRQVLHPGVRPRGFIRRNIRRFVRDLGKALRAKRQNKRPPTRAVLVNLVNRHLEYLLDRVRQETPVGEPSSRPERPDQTPLKDAWGVTFAQ